MIAYAGLAGLPPQAGLYTLLVTLAAYAIFGTSRHLVAAASNRVPRPGDLSPHRRVRLRIARGASAEAPRREDLGENPTEGGGR